MTSAASTPPLASGYSRRDLGPLPEDCVSRTRRPELRRSLAFDETSISRSMILARLVPGVAILAKGNGFGPSDFYEGIATEILGAPNRVTQCHCVTSLM